MNPSNRTVWGFTLPRGLLAMMAMVAAIESYLSWHAFNFMNHTSESWRTARQAAGGVATQADVLCLGDSLVKLALVPPVMEPRLHRSVYNLAALANTCPVTYFLLRRALEAGARPAAIVVDFDPGLLSTPPRDHNQSWPDVLKLRDAWELARTANDSSFFTIVALSRALPSFKARAEIRTSALANLNGNTVFSLASMAGYWRNWNRNQGAMVFPKNPQNAADSLNRFSSSHWQCRRLNEVYLKKTIQLAARRNIPLFWVLPPVIPQVQARREQRCYDADYLRFVRAAQAEFPTVIVIDGRHVGFDDTLFIDALHLDREGAGRFSVAVADAMAPWIDRAAEAPRWIELTSAQPALIDPPLEDLNQSRTALQDQWERRRR